MYVYVLISHPHVCVFPISMREAGVRMNPNLGQFLWVPWVSGDDLLEALEAVVDGGLV